MMSRLALLALFAPSARAGHCTRTTNVPNYCCSIGCDSSYDTGGGCSGAAAEVTMADIFATANADGCSPLTEGSCSYSPSNLDSCTAADYCGAGGCQTGVAQVGAHAATASGDPHLGLPHGGKADFRGEDKQIYNFLSAKDLSVNVMTQMADFELHPAGSPRHKDVHGSFLSQVHVVARTSTGKTVRVSYWADAITQDKDPNGHFKNYGFANGTVDSEPAFKLSGPMKEKKEVDDVTLQMSFSSLHVFTPEFEVTVTPRSFRLERNVIGLHHRLDVQIKPRVPEADFRVPPHGIIGQGWDGDDKAIDGEQDAFPESGEFTTYAMAKGAIEGVPNDYKVATKYATDFKYSRFDATTAAARNVAKLVAAGELAEPKIVASPDFATVGSKEITEDHL